MKRKKWVLIAVIILVVVGFPVLFMAELSHVRHLEIGDIDASALDDGVYQGRSGLFLRSNKVAVTVEDHRITDITVIRDAISPVEELRRPVFTELFQTVIDRQTTGVDVVSGATVTTKQYLKSIENALANARRD